MNVEAYQRAGLAQDFTSVWTVLRAMRARFGDWARRRVAYNETVAELSLLSDRDLSDLGLSRTDIPRVAREAAALA